MDEKDFRQAMKWYRRAPVTHVAPETGSLGVPLKKDVTHREKARVWFPRQTPSGSDRQQEGGDAGQPEKKPEEIMQGAVTVYQEKKVAAYGRMEKVDEPEAMDAPDVPLADAMSADNPPCDVDFRAVPDGEVLQLGMAEEPVSSEEGAVSGSPFEDMIASVEAGLASMLAEGPPVAGAGQADGEQVDDEVAALLAGMSEEERAEIAGFDLSLLKEDEPAQADGLASPEPALTAGMSEEERAEIAGFDPALLADGSEATMQAASGEEPESAAVEEEQVQADEASPVEAGTEEVPAAEEQIAEAAALAGGTEEAQAAGDEAEVSDEPVVPEAEEALLAGEREPDALEQEAADKAESGFDAESAAADEAAAGEEGTAFGVAPDKEAGAEEVISDEGETWPAGETLQEAGKDAEQEADGMPEICQEADADVAIEEPVAGATALAGGAEEATQVEQAAGDEADAADEPVMPEAEDGSAVAVNEHSGETEEASLAGESGPEATEAEQSTADQADDAQAQETESGVHEALPVEAEAAQAEQAVTVEEDIAETAAEPVAELAGQEPEDSLPQMVQAEEVFSGEAEAIPAASVASETSVKESDLPGMVPATAEDFAADDALAGEDEAEVLPDGEAEQAVPVQMALEESKAETAAKSGAFDGAEAEVAAEPVTEENITGVQLPEADQPEAAMQAASGEEPVQATGLGSFAESAAGDEETAQADEASPVEVDAGEVPAAEEQIAEAAALASGAEEETQAEQAAGDEAEVSDEPVVPEAEDGSAVAVIEHSGEAVASLAGENGPGAVDAGLSDEPGALVLEESKAEAAANSDAFDGTEAEIAAEAVTGESITDMQLPEADQPEAAMLAASGEEPESAVIEEAAQADEASPIEADAGEVPAAEEQIAEAAAVAGGAEEATQAEQAAGDEADAAGEPVVSEADGSGVTAVDENSGKAEEAHAGFNAKLAVFDGGGKEDAVVAAEAVAEGLLPEAAQAEEESAQVLPEDVFGGEEATLGIEPAGAVAGEADAGMAIEEQIAEAAALAGGAEEAQQAERAAGDDPVVPETEDGSAVAVNEHSSETEEASLAGESGPEATEAEQSTTDQADDAQAQETESGVHEALPVEAEAAQAEQTVTVEEDIAEAAAEPVTQVSSGAAVLPDPETALADGILLAEGEALPSAPVTMPDGMATGPKGVMPEEDVFRNKMRSHQLNRMAVAEYKVAAAYAREGTPEAYREAARWYIRAAEKGHAVSRFNLGNIYYAGRGVTQDYAKAADWYELAARQGVARAQDNLGLMFFHGRGRPVEPETAVYWFRQAAIQGFAPAQYKLAIHLEAGVGVETNREEALYWYRKAASQGHAQAEKEVARLEAEG